MSKINLRNQIISLLIVFMLIGLGKNQEYISKNINGLPNSDQDTNQPELNRKGTYGDLNLKIFWNVKFLINSFILLFSLKKIKKLRIEYSRFWKNSRNRINSLRAKRMNPIFSLARISQRLNSLNRISNNNHSLSNRSKKKNQKLKKLRVSNSSWSGKNRAYNRRSH